MLFAIIQLEKKEEEMNGFFAVVWSGTIILKLIHASSLNK